MTQPSLDLTRAVHEKLQVEVPQRTPQWKEEFYAAVEDAALALSEPQVVQGPDAFPYFRLQLPEPGVQFQAVSVAVVLEHCLDHGLGIVLNPREKQADWVFTFGNLWTRQAFGKFETWVDDPKQPEAGQERQIMLSSPSEEFLPTYARNALRGFLTERVKLAEPKVMQVQDAAARPERSLAFNVFREDCRDEQHFGAVMSYLRWYLPGHYGLLSVPKDAEITERFFPL
jgi:hypothetical protein